MGGVCRGMPLGLFRPACGDADARTIAPAAPKACSGARPTRPSRRSPMAAQTYVVFRLTLDGSPFYGQLQAALSKIRSHYLPGTGLDVVEAPLLEVYPEDFRQTRRGAFLDLYAPVEAGPEACEAP